jgi:hypothetical protein
MALNLAPAAASPGRWQKGQSGNPKGGKARIERSAAERARDYTEDAIKALVHALHHPPSRVPAAIALLDRGWGKPEQRIHAQSESTVLHLIAAQAFGVELQQQAPVIEITDQPADDTPKE